MGSPFGSRSLGASVEVPLEREESVLERGERDGVTPIADGIV